MCTINISWLLHIASISFIKQHNYNEQRARTLYTIKIPVLHCLQNDPLPDI
jgi:hypothetical protein